MKSVILYSILLTIIIGFSPLPIEGAAPTITYVASYDGGSSPMRIATDSSGRLYVTDPYNNRVLILSNSGKRLSTINKLGTPLGIAVDSSGKIYIGDSKKRNVGVFDSAGNLLYKLGSGDGEIGLPNDIAISSSTGKIYVTDTETNKVKVYNPDGSSAFSFGGQGTSTGKFGGIYGIAINDSTGEVIVSDWNNGYNNYARIQIFDLNGTYKTYFYTYSSSANYFTKLQGLVIDKQGRIYVTDDYQYLVQVFDRNSKTSLGIFGTPGTNRGELYSPIGVAIDPDNKLFITSYNSGRVEVYGLDTFNTLNLDPVSMTFTGEEGGINPPSQTLSITNGGNGTLQWTASTDQPWLTVNPSSGQAPSQVEVSVNISSLTVGTYKGVVTITTATGVVGTVSIELTVKSIPAILNVSPSSLSFKAQYNGQSPPFQKIYISNTGAGTMNWSASADQTWIGLDTTSGSGNSSSAVTVNTTSLNAGSYTGKLTVTAANAQGSPATIDVSLNLIYAGTLKVTTNLEQAEFEITPIGIGASYSGTGKEWSNEEVTPGDYTITFKHISGYIKPATRTFTIKTGQETVIDGQYRTKPVATNIIAGSGGTQGKSVVVLTLDGTQQIASFEPFNGPVSLRVAAGDLDGSGTDKIVVTDHKKSIKVYTSEGTELALSEMAEWYTKSVIAVADIDNDGKAEIIVGVKNDYDTVNIQREIKLFRYNNGTLEENDKLYTENKDKEFRIALGDTNGDGIAELLLADEDTVRSFSIDLLAASGNKLTEIWSKDTGYKETPEIAAGDINDDGIAEIALSISTDTNTGASSSRKRSKDTGSGGNTNTNNGNTNTNNGNTNTDNGNTNTGNGNTDTGNDGKGKDETSMIKLLKGTGEDYGLVIDAYGDLGYEKPSTVVLGDTDGDGIDEIAAGAGHDEKNEALIRIFESDGTFTGTTIKAMDSKFGANVSLGRF